MTEKISSKIADAPTLLSAKEHVLCSSSLPVKVWKISPTCCERLSVLLAVAFPPPADISTRCQSDRCYDILHADTHAHATCANAAEGVREITLTPMMFIVSAVPPCKFQ